MRKGQQAGSSAGEGTRQQAGSARRRFLCGAGAALAAPAALAAAPAKARADDEDARKIRAVHAAFARAVNAGIHRGGEGPFADAARHTVDTRIRRLTADGFGEQDVIEIAPDGRSATARIACIAEIEMPIDSNCTLVQMARAQGDGVVRHRERRRLEYGFVRRAGAWQIRSVALASPAPGAPGGQSRCGGRDGPAG